MYRITLSCSAVNQVGSYINDLFFYFTLPETDQSCYVLRYIRFFKSDDIVDMLEPAVPYKKEISPVLPPTVEVLEGVKPEL